MVLVKEISDLRYRYHVENDPSVTDDVYDSLTRELKTLIAHYPEFQALAEKINREAPGRAAPRAPDDDGSRGTSAACRGDRGVPHRTSPLRRDVGLGGDPPPGDGRGGSRPPPLRGHLPQ